MKYHINSVQYYYESGQAASLREQLQSFYKSMVQLENSSDYHKFTPNDYKILDFINSKPALLEKVLLAPFNFQASEFMKKMLIYSALRGAHLNSIDILYRSRVIAENVGVEGIIVDFDSAKSYPLKYEPVIDNVKILQLQEKYQFDLFLMRNIIVENALACHDFLGIDRLLEICSKEQIERIKLNLQTITKIIDLSFYNINNMRNSKNQTKGQLIENIKPRLPNKCLLEYIDSKLEKMFIEKNTTIQVNTKIKKVEKI